jgi:hypothetical protein
MIANEGLPGLQRSTLPRHHVFRHRRLGNLDAELEQLTVDLRRSPERVLEVHSSDQVANLLIDPRSAAERTGLPSPISGESHSVPAHDRLGPNDGYGVQDAAKPAIKPNELGAINRAKGWLRRLRTFSRLGGNQLLIMRIRTRSLRTK